MNRLAMLAMLLSAATACGQGVVYVNSGAGPGGDGTSWETAFDDLAVAIAAADALPGEAQVWVAAGTYRPCGPLNDRFLSYELRSHVGLFGGFIGGESHLDDRDWESNPTILSGDISDDDDPLANDIADPSLQDNSIHVLHGQSVDATAIVDGFIIRGGVARQDGPEDLRRGGGVYLTQASATFRNCVFKRNWASFLGGGLFATISSSPTLTSCRFEANQAYGGGGIWHAQAGTLTLKSCQFIGNAVGGEHGGGVSAQGNFLKAADCRFEANRRFGNNAVRGLGAESRCLKAFFTNCEFIDNAGGTDGGGLSVYYTQSDVEIVGCTFRGNSAYTGGGLRIDSDLGTHSIKSCVFEDNSSVDEGGGISLYRTDGTTISGCTFSGNASRVGGGIHATRGDLSISDCAFAGNTAQQTGGGVFAAHDTVITSSIFEDNHASSGGGILAGGENMLIQGCDFTGNSASVAGGAIAGWDTGSMVVDCTFESNSAPNGGAVRNEGGTPTFLGCAFSGNTATESGGAISSQHYNQPRELTLTDCVFEANSAQTGGALSLDGTFPTLTSCRFAVNQASVGDGGGIAARLSRPVLTNCTFDRNSAAARGGAMSWIANSDGSLVDCLISGNSAGGAGGAVYLDEFSDLTAAAVTLASNSSGGEGGALSLAGNATVLLRSSIAWGNTDAGGGGEDAQLALSGDAEASISYSLIQGWSGDLGGLANTGLNPQFADELGPDDQPATGDENFTPGPGSPAIDSGDNTAIPQGVTTDAAGNPRFIDDPSTADTGKGTAPVVDRGALEYEPVPCKPDLDGDGVLTIFDFLAFQNLFVAHDPAADLDGNGSFDLFDFLAYVNSFVAGCP